MTIDPEENLLQNSHDIAVEEKNDIPIQDEELVDNMDGIGSSLFFFVFSLTAALRETECPNPSI